MLARARGLAAACARHGVELPAAALQFPLRHPAVVSVVTGLRRPAQVADALARFAAPVPAGAWAGLAPA